MSIETALPKIHYLEHPLTVSSKCCSFYISTSPNYFSSKIHLEDKMLHDSNITFPMMSLFTWANVNCGIVWPRIIYYSGKIYGLNYQKYITQLPWPMSFSLLVMFYVGFIAAVKFLLFKACSMCCCHFLRQVYCVYWWQQSAMFVCYMPASQTMPFI